MDLWPIPYHEFRSFLLVLIRVGVILFMFPFFNARLIPMLSKAGLAFVITIVLFPVINHQTPGNMDSIMGMAQLILGELVVGMILGLLVHLFFEGVRMMGYLVGFQAGLTLANVIDPQSGTQVSILANLSYYVGFTVFLILNGHHMILGAMKQSFEILEVGSINLTDHVLQKIIPVSGDMFVIALKLGAPAIAVLIFTMVAFGLITKLIPQMNIMIVAFPVKIVIGLVFFGICLNVVQRVMERYVEDLTPLLLNSMVLLKG